MTAQPWVDTPQQKMVLRRSPTARKVRARFPYGARVHIRMTDRAGSGKLIALSVLGGTVYRHCPGTNAQGGEIIVDWDNGNRGRHSAINLERTDA